MRILFVYWDLHVGGVQHMTTKLANALSERGHRVTLAVAFRSPQCEPYQLSDNVRVVDFGAHRVRYFFFRLTAFLRHEKFDVIYSATTVPNMVTVLARGLALNRARLVISERDNPEEGLKATRSALERLTWRLKPVIYRGATSIVCVSTPLADALSKFTGISRKTIAVVHNPAEPEYSFLNTEAPHPWLHNKLIPVVIAAGRMHSQKDFPTLIRAFSLLREKLDARMIILGDGEERSKIENTIAECNVGEFVLLPGMQSDIMPWLVHSDLFAMSSVFEGFGNVLVQALSAGLPIVSTDCPDGPAEILNSGEYGRLTPVGDPIAMARAMEMTLSEPRNIDRQRARAGDFSVRTIVLRYEELFRSLG